MPHKRIPVVCEQISGLARLMRSNAQAALENVPLWHERDISHSSVERVILPDSTILLDYTLAKLTWIVSGLLVYPERMQENLDRMKGLVYSQTPPPGAREGRAHPGGRLRGGPARIHAGLGGEGTLLEMVLEEKPIVATLGAARGRACFDPREHLRAIPRTFPARVRSGRSGPAGAAGGKRAEARGDRRRGRVARRRRERLPRAPRPARSGARCARPVARSAAVV
jgi:adenylosuccinate lyase